MDHVKTFQAEMDALYKAKPPISKAKMANITKGAMKAIKMYKHVVQTVEKFISKCKPEYKVPGLYIIDSIIRQSRHQYGVDKDLFASRFCKNICTTFQNLYKCPEEDRSKIVRVLNLWQKNGVLPTEIIQPLMDLAQNPNDPVVFQTVHKKVEAATAAFVSKKPTGNTADGGKSKEEKQLKRKSTDNSSELLTAATEPENSNVQQMQLQQLQQLQQQLLQQTAMLQKIQGGDSRTAVDSQLLASLEQLTKQLINNKTEGEKSVIDKKLLDYDYGDSDDEDKPAQPGDNVQVLQEAMLIQQLKQMNEVLQKQQQMRAEQSMNELHANTELNAASKSISQGAEYDPNPPRVEDTRSHDHRHGDHMSRSRTHDTWREERERSRERREKERREREEREQKERQRRREGFPPVKPGHVIVCSCTLWIGHLSKQTNERDLVECVERYGNTSNIFLVKPRGCAYVTFGKRSDASHARERLGGFKLLGNSLKVAWAPPKVINEDKKLKEFWDVDSGAAYIPWGQMPSDMETLRSSQEAVIDESSLPSAVLSAAVAEADNNQSSSQPAAVDEAPALPGLGGIANAPVPAHIQLTGGALPPIHPGQIMPPVTQNLSQPPPIAVSTASHPMSHMQGAPIHMPPGQLPHGLQPGQMLQGQGPPGQMPPVQMPPGQGPPGQMPPGQGAPGQLPPGLQPGQLPPGAQIPPPGQLPPGVQLLMQGAQGLVPIQMPDGQLRFIRPAGPGGLPSGLIHGLQQLQSGQLQPGQQGAGLMQLPPGLMPLRPVLPTSTTANNPQLEQALHELMSNKAALQAVSAAQLQHMAAPNFSTSVSVGQLSQSVPISVQSQMIASQAALGNPADLQQQINFNQQLAGQMMNRQQEMNEENMRRRSPNREDDRGGNKWSGDRFNRDRNKDWNRQEDNRNGQLNPRGGSMGGDRRGENMHGGFREFDRRGPPPDFNMGGPPPRGIWRGDRPPPHFNMRGPPPNRAPAPHDNRGPRGASPGRAAGRGFRDRDRRESWGSRDRDTQEMPRERNEREEKWRTPERSHNSRDMPEPEPVINDLAFNKEDDKPAAKRSRWSNDPQGSKSGLDDASQKLALANAQAVAAKFAAKPEYEEGKEEKPVIDITQVNTEDTVSNVLGQLDDDDYDEDEEEGDSRSNEPPDASMNGTDGDSQLSAPEPEDNDSTNDYQQAKTIESSNEVTNSEDNTME